MLCVIGTHASMADEPCPPLLPPEVEAALVPVLEARATALRLKIEWDKNYEKAFVSLLNAKTKAASQARVALMDYYVGEAYGEELVCAVAQDAANVCSLLELHSRCDIKPTTSVLPRDRTLPLREFALKLLKNGNAKQSCTFE